MNARTVTVLVGLVAVGAMAGLFFGWMVSVIPGLKRVPDVTYVTTMQSINRAIVNPAFVGPFLATPALLGLAAWLSFAAGQHRRAWWLVCAAVTYVIGVLGVTFGGNIPLNDALDSFDLGAATERALADRRQSYESGWNRWHAVRTVASLVAFALAGVATLADGDSTE